MDGLNLKFSGFRLENYFDFDANGALIARKDALQMDAVASKVKRQLSADTGLYRRLTDMYYRTDVTFTDNPTGNTPTLGVGAKRYGKRPITLGAKRKLEELKHRSPRTESLLKKREAKIVQDQMEYIKLYESCEPADKAGTEYVQWLVEGDQVMTGGGFDNNAIGDVQKSALSFISKGNSHVEFGNNQFSELVVEGSLWLRDQLKQAGMREGSITPIGCSAVRQEQDSDGMICFPVYSKAFAPLTSDIATRLLLDSGVDTREFVGTQVADVRTEKKEMIDYPVVNAIAYVLDHMIIRSLADAPSIITILARIQKHGWKKEGGELVPKKSKTRSVYPNAALPGMIEAMIISPFNDELQRLKFKFMPSLQDKPTRVEIMTDLIKRGHAAGYEFLSLDESAYDATVIGSALATVMYYAVRPFINARYYDWFDFAICALCFKYLMLDTALSSISSDDFATAKESGPWVEVKPFTVFGMIDGLISGAKFTHVGGSLYGGVVIHYVMPKMMNFEPFLGVQAGDDCVWAYPREMVDYGSMEKTYGPVEDTAKKVGLDINKTKQIWHVVNGELVNIFLQDVYHESTNTWGTGSIFRPLTAVFFSERNKGLSIPEQFMAEIARMNQGSDCYLAEVGVRKWLELEEFIGLLFKEQGANAFRTIVDSTGMKVEEIAERIGVGSFTYGISREDMAKGSVPIVPIIAKVASEMTFHSDLAAALKSLGEPAEDHISSAGSVVETPDIGDSDDVLGD